MAVSACFVSVYFASPFHVCPIFTVTSKEIFAQWVCRYLFKRDEHCASHEAISWWKLQCFKQILCLVARLNQSRTNIRTRPISNQAKTSQGWSRTKLGLKGNKTGSNMIYYFFWWSKSSENLVWQLSALSVNRCFLSTNSQRNSQNWLDLISGFHSIVNISSPFRSSIFLLSVSECTLMIIDTLLK